MVCQIISMTKRNHWGHSFLYQYFCDLFKLENRHTFSMWQWQKSNRLINCLLRGLWWPCFNQRYRWLFALHLSSYCLVILQLPQSQHPFVTSRNHDMNLTFLIPPRGSALPWSSPWPWWARNWGKVLLVRTEWQLGFIKQPSLSSSDPSLHKCQQKEPGSARAARGRHKTGNPEGQN